MWKVVNTFFGLQFFFLLRSVLTFFAIKKFAFDFLLKTHRCLR